MSDGEQRSFINTEMWVVALALNIVIGSAGGLFSCLGLSFPL